MVYVCIKCGRRFETEATTTPNGAICPKCSATLPPPRTAIIRPIVDDLLVTMLEDLATRKLPDVKAKHRDVISKHDIKDDELLSELKRRLRRLR